MDTLELNGEDLSNICYDLREIKVTCSGATDNLRYMMDQIPLGSGCIITIEGVDDGEEEVDEDGEEEWT